MAKSIAENKNRKRGPGGRPATGHDPAVALRLAKEKIAAVDKWAAKNGISSRSEALRLLIERGLEK
jgi:Ribbon-helix-helix protein, copG family